MARIAAVSAMRSREVPYGDQVPPERTEAFPDLEHEARVDYVLGRGAEVNVLRHLVTHELTEPRG